VTYVKALGIRLALMVRPLNHRIFNITGGISRRRSEVADLARQLVPGARITLGPGYPASAHLRGPSVPRRAGEELGYAPRYTLETGMTDWLVYLQRSAALKGA
jgi:nucleoside-diphosphate-sugar epimerase